ncbi:MAG: TonB-dependent receptor [Verrucomicrobia bacterium]|nr:TonB-dependent receptor [Verrucomicrobiota bacterium]
MNPPVTVRPAAAALSALLVLSPFAAAQTARPSPAVAADQPVTLPEFRVETNQDNSYLATETTSGTRTAAKLLDLPFSVQSLPSEFFNDFMLFDFDELNGFVSNVKPADAAGAGNGGSRLRGFGMPQFRNGFSIIQQPDSNNVDRVEVLKGPSAGVYGATAPGGVINFITKKPKARAESSLEVIGGDNHYKRVSGSTTGPITKNVFYRLDGTYYDFNRPTDWWYNRTLDLSGGLIYKFNANTSVNLEFAFTQRNANPFVVFTRWVDRSNRTQGLVYTIPEDQYPGYGERLTRFNQAGPYNRYQRYNNSSYLTFQHRFNQVWSVQANLSNTNRHFRRFGPTSLGNWSFVTNNWTGSRSPYHQEFVYEQDGAQVDFAGKFKTGGVVHQSHVGFDWIYLGQKQKTWNLTNAAAITALLPPGVTLAAWQKPSPFDPDFLVRAGQPTFVDTWPMVDGSTFNLYNEELGVFYNHMASFADERLVLMATGRADTYTIHRKQPLSTRATLRDATSDKKYTTYSVGLSYKLAGEKLVAYGSYGSSFDPNPSVDTNTGDVYGNTEATGGELGFKGVLLHGSFSYSAAAFTARQENETTSNPDNPGGTNPLLPALAPGGSTRSRGIGLDVSGKLTTNLSLIGNMGWLDARTVQNRAAPANVGQRVANSGPARKGSVAATYAFSGRLLKGLRAGLTYYYSTENVRIYSTSATTTTVYLPANSYWGGMMAYAWKVRGNKTLSLHLAVTDIFGQQILTDNAFWPAGAQWKLSTALRF